MRTALSFGFLLACGIVAAGCGRQDSGKVEIRYMAWGNPEALELEQQFCDEFNRRNPDVHVRFFRVPGSAYLDKAIVMLASRTAPDVIRIDHYNFPQLVRKNYFTDMTPLAAADKEFKREDFFPQALDEGMYEGKLYGLNALGGGIILYYNKTAVKEAGLDDPYDLSKRGEWTWQRFRQHAIAMTKKGPNGRYTRFGCTVPGLPMNAPVIWGFGGEILSADGKKCLLDSPQAIEAYQFMADLRWVDHCTPTPSQAANSAYTFEGGKVAMEFNWMGQAPRYRKVIRGFDWDICPLPSGPAGGATCTKGNQLVIAANSEHPKEAWRFIRFLTSYEIEMDLLGRRRRAFPSRRAVAYSKEFLDAKEPPFHTDVFVKAFETGRPLPITERWSEWTTAFWGEQDNLFSGRERDAGAAMRRGVARANEVLASEEGF